MIASAGLDWALLEDLPTWTLLAKPKTRLMDAHEMVRLLDLTSLNGDDTEMKIRALALRATRPLGEHDKGVVASVCVFPAFLPLLGTWLESAGVKTCTVAGGFPHALSPLRSRLFEAGEAAKLADELDVPIPRHLAIEGAWETLFHELVEVRAAAPSSTLKIILSLTDLHDPDTAYRAAMVAMMAGADFVKTSTGKDGDVAEIMLAQPFLAAVRNYHEATGRKVGVKFAGGIPAAEASAWLALTADVLGEDWITPATCRIGSSGLLDDLARLSTG